MNRWCDKISKMTRFISAHQYKKLTKIPRGRLAVRTKIWCGAIIAKNGKVLMVKDKEDKYGGWDFPGGKLLWDEDVFSCATREVLEEGRYKVKLEKLLGIYQRKTGPDDEDYFRFVFIGKPTSEKQRKIGDPDILETKLISVKKILDNQEKVRSPEVIRELTDYTKGKKFSLDAVSLYVW